MKYLNLSFNKNKNKNSKIQKLRRYYREEKLRKEFKIFFLMHILI